MDSYKVTNNELFQAARRALRRWPRLRLSTHVDEDGDTVLELSSFNGVGWSVVARAVSRPALLLRLIEIRRAKELEHHKPLPYGR
jgi:hypothetical protein